MARFKADLDDYALVEAVRDVLLSDPSADPSRMTQARFNELRSNTSRGAVPRAASVCERLELSWPQLKEAALRPSERKRQQSVVGKRRSELGTVSEEVAAAALRWAAARLGQDTLRPAEYREVWEEVRSTSGRRWRHGQPPPLPNPNRIEFGHDWDHLCDLAGLNQRAKHGTPPAGTPVEETIEAFIEAFGAYPTLTQLRSWMQLNSRSLSNSTKDDPFTAVRARILERRRAAGLPDVSVCPRDTELRVSHGAPAPPETGDPARRKPWTRDAIVAGLIRALDELGPGENLTQKRLLDLSRKHRDIPAPGRLDAFGGLTKLRGEAAKTRAAVSP